MENVIKVGMADLQVSAHPGILTTLGLGSCVGIALYDPTTKVAGLAHIMLPSSQLVRTNTNIAKFADTAIVKLLKDMLQLGARKSCIIAKLAGGAQMFAFSEASEMMRIGARNIAASRDKLLELCIPVVSDDTGGNYGRTIELYSNDGRLLIKTIGHGVRQI